MVLIVNIDSNIIYEGLYQQLLSKPSIIGIEETHFTHNSGKWLNVTTKKNKDQDQIDIDSLMSNGEMSTSIEHSPGRIFKVNTRAGFILYTAMIQGDTQKYNEAITDPSHSSQKRHVIISYDLTDETPPTS